MKKIVFLAIVLASGTSLMGQTANANYPENNLAPNYAADTGAVNALVAQVTSCSSTLFNGEVVKIKPANANTTTTPTLAYCGASAKTITKFGTATVAASDLTTTAIAVLIYDGTNFELQNPQTNSTAGTVTSIATTAPITGGTITTTGTIACATCVTSAASLTSTNLITGAGSQGIQVNANDTVNTGGIFTLYDNLTTAGLAFPVVQGVSDKTAQSASVTSTNIIASTAAAGHYLVRVYLDQNAVCTTGTGSVYATISWTDATNARTAQTVPLTLATTQSASTGYIDAAIPLWSATASAISYTTTYTACATGTATYDIHLEAERTN